jgi:hypothetical protein
MRTRLVTRYWLSICLIGGAFVFACDESLPPYEQPSNFLRAELGVVDGMIDRQVICDYTFTRWNPGTIAFRINVINTFDETLQGPASAVTGQVEVWKKDDPDFGRTIPIFGATDPRHVRFGVLTLDPGDTLEVAVDWFHDDIQNRRIWKVFRFRPLNTAIRARARLKVFNDAPELFPPEFEVKVKYDIDLNNDVCANQ